MRLAAALFLVLAFVSGQPAAGQAPAPIGPPPNLNPSAAPDLSGAWLRSGGLQSVSAVDTWGKMRGKEPDIPYQNCSVRDNDAFTETLLNDAVPK